MNDTYVGATTGGNEIKAQELGTNSFLELGKNLWMDRGVQLLSDLTKQPAAELGAPMRNG